MKTHEDPILDSIIKELTTRQSCHTVILYGSRARGLTTATSDYDVVGVRKAGSKLRIAKKQSGFFWDVFVYPEKDLKALGEEHFAWKNARIVFQRDNYGTRLLVRLEKLLKRPFKKHPEYEVAVTKIWAQKQLDRCRIHDLQGAFRRAEFLAALVDHYFFVRQKRFLDPKEGFAWLRANDLQTYKLVKRALENPQHIGHLKKAAESVYRVKLD